MKKEIRHFWVRGFELSVLFFLMDLVFKFTTRPFPVYPEPEFWGTILLYLFVGYIIVGIPLIYRKFWGKEEIEKQPTNS